MQVETNIPTPKKRTAQEMINSNYVEFARGNFGELWPEIARRNETILLNDQYIYGEKLEHMLDIPLGHDMTPVNWLRRVVEIHKSQFMGKGFKIDSTYIAEDISASGADDQNAVGDPQLKQQAAAEKQRLIIENEKKKTYAEVRRRIIESIFRDNGGDSFWTTAAENASAIGDTVVKAWYDETEKRYIMQQVERVENFYARWSRNDYRDYDATAYIEQISLQRAMQLYNVPEDVQLSPMGAPLSILATGDVVESSQPMVTVMEITGKVQGFKSDGKGTIITCPVGQETELNVIAVGNTVYQVIDDPKQIPKYYIFPNKRVRRRPWGIPDVTRAAVMINLTYIEALSDWRTVSSKVNFTKYKAFGFPTGTQVPKPRPRTVEILPMSEGQDIQVINDGNAGQHAQVDFPHQLSEMETQFVREVGISRQLFDMPDAPDKPNIATLTSMKSISDITDGKRKLWGPIIRKMCEDALHVIALHDKNVANVVNDDTDWYIKIGWGSSLTADDPSYHAMELNQFNMGLMSIQTYLENMGYDKQELDRIREEMEDPLTAAIHGHTLSEMAQYKLIPFGTPLPPKVSVNIRGDMTPEQEGNLAFSRGFNDGPYGTSAGPQGNAGRSAEDKSNNQGYVSGDKPGPTAINKTPNGSAANPALSSNQPGQQLGQGVSPAIGGQGEGGGFTAGAPQSPQPINTQTQGMGIMSQPGSGATATSAKGKLAQKAQRKGK